MKSITQLFCLLLLVSLGCSKDESLSKHDQIVKNISATWGNAQVMHATDGDLSFQYEDFAITFAKNSSSGADGFFIVENGSHAFPDASGQWSLSSDLSKIEISTGAAWDFTLTGNSLTLEFDIPDSGGRTNGLTGHVVFELTKEK